MSQDAHNCAPEFDEDTAMFAVYDGHGGKTKRTLLCVILQNILPLYCIPFCLSQISGGLCASV